MKKWFFRAFISLLAVGTGIGIYLFQTYGNLLTNSVTAAEAQGLMQQSNAQFAEVLAVYAGSDFAAEISSEMSAALPEAVKAPSTGQPDAAVATVAPPQTKTQPKTSASAQTSAEAADSALQEAPLLEQVALIQAYVEELMAVKQVYSDQLQALIEQAKATYSALPEAERTSEAKMKVGLQYMDKIITLESQADAEIYGVISRLEAALREKDLDTGIVQEIRDYYESQKELQRMYYMTKLKS